ncbi:MAG: class II fructose-bisphosphate aldolase, partial [Patescibacteria group bacterium]
HLDHGHDFDLIKKAIDLGYSSVMIDASDKPFDENIKQVKRVVRYAHARKVWVQAELGQLAGAEDWIKVNEANEFFTDPLEAKRFVTLTKIDTFAPAVGNYHGVAKIVGKKKLKLNLKLLEKIDKLVSVPLVLHGASGFPAKEIKGAIKAGIRIINIDSELRVSFVKAEKKFLAANKNEFDPRKVLTPAIQEMTKTVEKKIIMFGSRNKV